jgi:hypothetical protein
MCRSRNCDCGGLTLINDNVANRILLKYERRLTGASTKSLSTVVSLRFPYKLCVADREWITWPYLWKQYLNLSGDESSGCIQVDAYS